MEARIRDLRARRAANRAKQEAKAAQKAAAKAARTEAKEAAKASKEAARAAARGRRQEAVSRRHAIHAQRDAAERNGMAARAVANAFGCKHHEHIFTAEEAFNIVPKVVYHLETCAQAREAHNHTHHTAPLPHTPRPVYVCMPSHAA